MQSYTPSMPTTENATNPGTYYQYPYAPGQRLFDNVPPDRQGGPSIMWAGQILVDQNFVQMVTLSQTAHMRFVAGEVESVRKDIEAYTDAKYKQMFDGWKRSEENQMTSVRSDWARAMNQSEEDQKTIRQLNDQYLEQVRMNSRLMEDTAYLRKDLDDLRTKYEKLKTHNSKDDQATNRQLHDQCMEQVRMNSRLMEDAGVLRKDLDDLQAKNEELTRHNDGLKYQNARLPLANTQKVRDLTKEVETLRSNNVFLMQQNVQLKLQAKDANRLTEERKKAEDDAKVYAQQATFFREKNQAVSAELAEAKDTASKLSAELEAAKAIIAEHESTAKALRSELAEANRKLKATENITQELEKAKETIRSSHNAVAVARQFERDGMKRIKDLEKAVKEYETKFFEQRDVCQATLKLHKALAAQFKDKEAETNKLEKALEEYGTKFVEQRDKYKETLNSHKAMASEFKAQQEETEKLRQVNKRLMAKVKEANDNPEVTQLKAELEELRALNTRIKRESAKYKDQYEMIKPECQRLLQDVANLTEENELLKRNFQNFQKNIEELGGIRLDDIDDPEVNEQERRLNMFERSTGLSLNAIFKQVQEEYPDKDLNAK